MTMMMMMMMTTMMTITTTAIEKAHFGAIHVLHRSFVRILWLGVIEFTTLTNVWVLTHVLFNDLYN
jgi:hypothetical protein